MSKRKVRPIPRKGMWHPPPSRENAVMKLLWENGNNPLSLVQIGNAIGLVRASSISSTLKNMMQKGRLMVANPGGKPLLYKIEDTELF